MSGAGLGLEGGHHDGEGWDHHGCDDRHGWGWGHDDGFCRAVVITADSGGAAWTPDEGNTWYALPNVSGYWATAFANPHSGWLVGRNGAILKISF